MRNWNLQRRPHPPSPLSQYSRLSAILPNTDTITTITPTTTTPTFTSLTVQQAVCHNSAQHRHNNHHHLQQRPHPPSLLSQYSRLSAIILPNTDDTITTITPNNDHTHLYQHRSRPITTNTDPYLQPSPTTTTTTSIFHDHALNVAAGPGVLEDTDGRSQRQVCLCVQHGYNDITMIHEMSFSPIMCMYISCVGLCVHVFMNPMSS